MGAEGHAKEMDGRKLKIKKMTTIYLKNISEPRRNCAERVI